MDTRITVADARAALYTEVDATDINSALFIPALNEVVERYMNSGKWKGQTPFLTIPANDLNYITLPRWYVSVLVSNYQRVPRPVFTPFYPFSESGPGIWPDPNAWVGRLIDLGDGWVTQYDITTAGTLSLQATNASDAGKVVRVFGLDANGNDVFTPSTGQLGVDVTLTYPAAAVTTQVFSLVNGIQAPNTIIAPWTLSVVNSPSNVLLSTYYPGETRPCYRRYQMGVREDAVLLICNRRFIPLRAETDWVIPGNISALRYGLQALNNQKAGQYDLARAAFQEGLDYLNQEAKSARGGAQISLQLDPTLMAFYGCQMGA